MKGFTLSAERLDAAAALIDELAAKAAGDDARAYSMLRGAELMLNALGLDWEDDDWNARICRIEAAESR